MSKIKRSKFENEKGKKRFASRSINKSRKEVRKEQRKQKKINRAAYSKRKNELARGNTERHRETVDINSEKANRMKVVQKGSKVKNGSERNEKEILERKIDKLEKRKRNQKNELLKEANLKEDRLIKKLEKQLKLNKRKKKTIPKSFVEDGLGYLLDFCLEKDKRSSLKVDEGFEEDKSQISDENIWKGKRMNSDKRRSISEDETGDCDNLGSEDDDENEMGDISEDESKNESNNDSDSDIAATDVDAKELNSDYDESNTVPTNNMPETNKAKLSDSKKSCNVSDDSDGLWEDIYGRKRDAQGNVIQSSNKYLPPAARVASCSETTNDEKLRLLKKQVKGQLNRVTEQNIHYITNQIEGMYMTNSRNSMNYVLTELTLESLISPILTPDRLVCEHMMLIAILHANVGTEVGANFLEKLVKLLIEKMEKQQDTENKELDNVILMISHLYNFRVYGYKLLYQILNRLVEKFTEKDIELILLVLKTVGFTLRKDDPNALKEFIHNLQLKAKDENTNSLRVKFMLEVLTGIKNNNINKIPQYDPTHVEHLKKIMKGVIRKGNSITQFNVSLDDLLHADENGKWWIVGSAWSGTINSSNKTKNEDQSKLNFSKKILELAQKQRMNTDARKNIFCILVTAEDYLDAFEKLHHLGLKNQQEADIIHVLMHCCLQEKKFNPYYAILAQRLCEYNRKYQLTIQYAFWDKVKTFNTCEKKQLHNLAEFLTHLLMEKCLALSVLKIIPFTELDERTMKFVRRIMLGILLHENEDACFQVFKRISLHSQLQPFRESLRLFLTCFLVKNIDSCDLLDKEKAIVLKRVESVDRILISREYNFVF